MAKNSLTKNLTILTLTKTAFHRGIKPMGLSGLRGLSVYVKMFIDNTDVGNSNSDSKRGVSP